MVKEFEDYINSLGLNYSNNFVIYTSIFGNYDILNKIPSNLFLKLQKANIDCICFTDNLKIKSNKWNIVYVKGLHNKPRLDAKMYKLFPHILFPLTKNSLWVDGNYKLTNYVDLFILKYANLNEIMFFRHPVRNCIYKEAQYLIKNKPEFSSSDIKNQFIAYKTDNYPINNGLIHGAIILRMHNCLNTISLMRMWYDQIILYTIRDQLSFNYICFKKNYEIKYFDDNILTYEFFLFRKHVKSTFLQKIKSFFNAQIN